MKIKNKRLLELTLVTWITAVLCKSRSQSSKGHKNSEISYHHASKNECKHVAEAGSEYATAFKLGEKEWCVEDGEHTTGVAWIRWEATMEEIGWGKLTVTTNGEASDKDQSYAAGLVEGVATQKEIWHFLQNLSESAITKLKLKQFFSCHEKYLRDSCQGMSASSNKKSEQFWAGVCNVLTQMDGMFDGYMMVAPSSGSEAIDVYDLWRLNMDGDQFDLSDALNRGYALDNCKTNFERASMEEIGVEINVGNRANSAANLDLDISAYRQHRLAEEEMSWKSLMRSRFKRSQSITNNLQRFSESNAIVKQNLNQLQMTEEAELWKKLVRTGRCTAVIRFLDDKSDVIASHASWEGYEEMLRVYKHYEINLSNIKSKKISFSAYPGTISSTDDWYICSSGLLVIETTIELVDKVNMLKQINSKKGVASWIRSVVASRLAADATEWVKMQASHNSGTYNCQWMVLDYNKFTPGQDPESGFFQVLETIPGMTHFEDMTAHLIEHGFFGSANRPMFPSIRSKAGYFPEHTEDLDYFSFFKNPRYMIIAREAQNITSISDMKHVIRLNDYENDEYSDKDPTLAIAARYDLSPLPSYSGAVDGKVVGVEGVRALTCEAILGPTTEGGLEPFEFTEDMDIKHEGIPDKFNFDWVEMGFGNKL